MKPIVLLKRVIFVAALIPAAMLIVGAFRGTLTANPIDYITDRTGDWALRFLMITLCITPLRRITGWNPIIKLRRMLGLFSPKRRKAAAEARKQAPAPKDPAHLTDAEKIAYYNEWAGYAASAGTYEVKGNTIINHNILAKMVGGMTITEEATILNFDGNSFTATPKSGNPNSGRQTTYTRVR